MSASSSPGLLLYFQSIQMAKLIAITNNYRREQDPCCCHSCCYYGSHQIIGLIKAVVILNELIYMFKQMALLLYVVTSPGALFTLLHY